MRVTELRMGVRTCYHCLYAGWLRPGRSAVMTGDWLSRLLCVNSLTAPGELREVAPTGTCRNFRPRPRPAERPQTPPPARDAVRYIALTKGLFATVDAADFEWLSRYRWHATGTHGRYYAATIIDGKSVAMHRLLMHPPEGMVVDHADGERLNNRRANLRICTPEENRHNTRPLGKSCPYVGVRPHGDKWRARITVKGESLFLGDYDDVRGAAKARDAAARRHHGLYAWINIPDEDPPEEGEK